ncbi:hypothetical protein NFHSH190041_03570 [Shewanella sp. NFH-SH190041]|nr:hypothetical protein NFHSH190041_03570 [Shewanella sp. NFH-SH190041]
MLQPAKGESIRFPGILARVSVRSTLFKPYFCQTRWLCEPVTCNRIPVGFSPGVVCAPQSGAFH